MKKHNKITKLALGISASMLLLSQNVYAEELKELESKKSQLEQKTVESETKKSKLEKELSQVEKDIVVLERKLEEVNALINNTEKKISDKEVLIQNTETEIKTIKAIIKEKEIELEKKKEKIKQNLQLMSTRGEVQFLEFLFRSESISQFLYRYETFSNIKNKGEELHKEAVEQLNYINEQKQLLDKKKNQLVSDKSELEANKANLVSQKIEQQKLQSQLNKKREEVKDEIHEEEQAMKEIALLIADADRQIKVEKSRIEEARRKAEAERQRKIEEERLRKMEEERIRQESANSQSPSSSNGHSNNSSSSSNGDSSSSYSTNLGSGVLGQPMAPGTYRLSSHYGYRIHPVYGTKKLHNGVDYAAPRNTPIYAMEDGYVLLAGKASGYGNWIVIKHDNGLYSIYGHMYSDGVYVRQGEYVFRGQKIGGVGSAGTSTGNHLHFCVATSFSGGTFSYVNPLNYIR